MGIKIGTIKGLLDSKVSIELILELCNKLYDMTAFISTDYPKHKSWYYQKQLPETLDPEARRDILFAYDENQNIYGTAFIKSDNTEKKICTLFVSEDSRGLGIGTKLVEKSMEILGTTKPVITLADYKLPMFEGLIEKYNWEKTEEVSGLYNDRSVELVYNGKLTQEK